MASPPSRPMFASGASRSGGLSVKRTPRQQGSRSAGQKIAAPQHGDEISPQQSANMHAYSGQKRRQTASPYVRTGVNTLDHESQRQNPMDTVPTVRFYEKNVTNVASQRASNGRLDAVNQNGTRFPATPAFPSVSRLASGAGGSSSSARRLDLQRDDEDVKYSPSQHRNASQTPATTRKAAGLLMRPIPEAGKPKTLNQGSPTEGDPIEISSDEDEDAIGSQDAEQQVESSPSNPYSAKLQADRAARSERLSPVTPFSAKGKERANDHFAEPFSSMRKSCSPQTSGRVTEGERVGKTPGVSRHNDFAAGTSPSPSSSRSPEMESNYALNPERGFRVAREEDSEVLGRSRQTRQASRFRPHATGLAARLKDREGNVRRGKDTGRRRTSPPTAASSRPRVELVDKFRTGFVNRAGTPLQADKPGGSQEPEQSPHIDARLDAFGIEGIGRVDESYTPRATAEEDFSILLHCEVNAHRYTFPLPSDSIAKVEVSGPEGTPFTACLTLTKDSEALRGISQQLLEPDAVSDVNIFLTSPPSLTSTEATEWKRLLSRFCQLCQNCKEVGTNFSTLHVSRVRNMSLVPSLKNALPRSAQRPRPRPSVKAQVQTASLLQSPGTGSNGQQKDTEDHSDANELERQPLQTIDPAKKRLTWPFEGGNAVTLFQSDIERLDEGQFLNDTMIEFGLKYLLARIEERDPKLHSEIYVFSSFFYRRFSENKKDRKQSYEHVRKWTRAVDLFEKKYIIVPINEAFHWYLAIITNPFLAVPASFNDDGVAQRVAPPDSTHSTDNGGELNTLPFHRKQDEVSGARGPSTDSFTIPPRRKSLGEERLSPAGESVQSDNEQSRKESEPSGSIPIRDARKSFWDARQREYAQTSSSQHQSNEISNAGGGTIVGGGSPASRRGTPITPGLTFQQEGKQDENDHVEDGDTSSVAGGVPMKRRFNDAIDIDDETESTQGSTTGIKLYGAHSRQLRSRGPVEQTRSLGLSVRRPSTEDQRAKLRAWLSDKASVLVFDSLASRHPGVRTALREYLCLEYRDKRGGELEVCDMEVEYIDVQMPQQDNYSDCGLYVLYAFERFFSAPGTFMDDVIPSRNREHECWNASEAVTRRQWWRSEVLRLAGEWEAIQSKKSKAQRAEKAARAAAAFMQAPSTSSASSEDGTTSDCGIQDSTIPEDGDSHEAGATTSRKHKAQGEAQQEDGQMIPVTCPPTEDVPSAPEAEAAGGEVDAMTLESTQEGNGFDISDP